MTQPPPDTAAETDLTPEQVLEHDAQYALMQFRQEGRLRPRIYAVTSDHKLLVIPVPEMESRHDQDMFAATVHMIFLAYPVVRYSHMTEAWFAVPAPDETEFRLPSERPDRREALVVSVIARETRLLRIYEIKRDPRGTVTDLPVFMEKGEGHVKSWLHEFLPRRQPTAHDREMARRMLPTFGIEISEQRYQPPTRH